MDPGLLRDLVRVIMQVAVSVTLLVVGLIIVLGKYDDGLKKGAFTWIGAVIGYWLK